MDHRVGMMRNLTGKANMNDEKSPPHYLRGPASSCHDFCKYGKKNDSMSTQRHVKVPAHLGRPKIPNAESSSKKLGTAQGRQKGEKPRLKTAFQLDDNVSCGSGVNKMSILLQSDVSNDPTECLSDESVSMKPRPPSPFQKCITTLENNSSVLEDGSLEEPTIVMHEEEPSIIEESIVSIDGSAIMELETPPSRESMDSAHSSSGPKLKKSPMVSEVPQLTTISSVSGPTNQAKESSNRYRSMKQGPAATMQKSMISAMAISSKDPDSIKPKEQKQVKSWMAEDKGRRDVTMLRSLMLMKPSVPYRVEAKKKVNEFVELGVTNEKFHIVDKTVKPKQAGLMHVKEPCTSLSPIIIKKNTSSSTKRIQLSPKPALLLKTKAPVVMCRLPLMDSGRIAGQTSQESNKIARTAGMSKLREEKLLKQSVASPVPKSTVNWSPMIKTRKSRSAKNQVEHEKMDAVDEKIKEKTIHVVDEKLVGTAPKPVEQKHIKLGSQKSSGTLSSRFPLSSSAPVSSGYREENDGYLLTQSEGSGSASCGEGKGRRTPFCFKKCDDKTIQKRTANAGLEEKELSTYKLTFCRGKVVSPLRESTGHRRLRFLQAKAAAEPEKLNGEIGMRSFGKNGELPAASPATPIPGSPTVLLRHQDVQEKNTQALFNDVIEETANRLVETRKSKVKALVGAFETIISLQERMFSE